MLTLAYESVSPNPRRGWATLTSFALQGTALAVALLIPILQPSLLPRLDLTPHLVPIFLPHMETQTVQRGSSKPSLTGNFSAFIAPWKVPDSTDRTADIKATSDPESPCLGCIPGPGQSSTLPTGMYISVAPPPPLPTPVAKPPRVSVMMDGYLIHRIQPDYPIPARQNRVQGPVEIAALISKQGTIENLQVLRGHPMLVPAALNAVKQWRYRPYILNGDPIEVDTKITVIFTLGN
jgi:protein TonB